MGNNFTKVWLETLSDLIHDGERVAPRGLATYDIPGRQIVVDMRDPVLRVAARKLSYQFMAAEAHWILTGDDSTAGIVPWNKRIAEFSDDGVRFFGAYGPPIQAQLNHVVESICRDPATRQAALTIWRQNPPATRDTPCTVAMVFRLRGLKLDNHVFMRSSDAWLGLPYDVFNFSMVAHQVCCRLNHDKRLERWVEPGDLYLTCASSHLYERDRPGAEECLKNAHVFHRRETPPRLHDSEVSLIKTLADLRDSKPGDPLRWWEER